MAKLLFDTDVIIDFLREKKEQKESCPLLETKICPVVLP